MTQATATRLEDRKTAASAVDPGGTPGRTPEARGRPAPGPPGVFGVRNVLRFVREPLTLLRDMADRYGDVVEMKVLGRPWFLISHPDLVESVMVEHARQMGRDEYAVVLQRALGLGLLTSDGELWKRQRKLMSQAFTPRRIKGYAEAMVEVTARGMAPLAHETEINVHAEMSRITMEVVAEVLFGAGIGPREVGIVGDAMVVINDFLANSPEAVFKLPGWVPTPRNRRMNAAVEAIDSLIYEIIDQRRQGEAKDDLLGTLLAAQDDEGSKMSDQQLRDEVITLFLAGHETTSLLLSHTLYLLSKHPDVERRLHAEIASALEGRLPTVEDVKALPFTKQVLEESMRLYPPAWTTGREALEEVRVGEYVLPKGAQILLSQWVVHRDPRFFPNPEGFDPDRFSPERSAGRPRYAYFPFGGGPRVCIGNHFAMLEATLILAMLVSRARFELVPGERLELSPSVTLRQRGPGLRMRVVHRDTP